MPSTVIRSYRYDSHKRDLHVVFQSGRVYTYLQVPEDIHAGLQRAPAKGQFFNRFIRDKFAFRRAGAGDARRALAEQDAA
jgi:lysyl-tRNA synthetase class 2